MEAITLLFVAGLVVVGLYVTALVRSDILSGQELERERRRELWRSRIRGR